MNKSLMKKKIANKIRENIKYLDRKVNKRGRERNENNIRYRKYQKIIINCRGNKEIFNGNMEKEN